MYPAYNLLGKQHGTQGEADDRQSLCFQELTPQCKKQQQWCQEGSRVPHTPPFRNNQIRVIKSSLNTIATKYNLCNADLIDKTPWSHFARLLPLSPSAQLLRPMVGNTHMKPAVAISCGKWQKHKVLYTPKWWLLRDSNFRKNCREFINSADTFCMQILESLGEEKQQRKHMASSLPITAEFSMPGG